MGFSLKGSLALLSVCILATNLNLNAASYPKPVGPLQRISPAPGFPDPTFVNLIAVADNWYQLPIYPGLTPYPSNYLGGVRAQFNTYRGGGPTINPTNDKIIVTNFSQNFWFDSTFTYIPIVNGTYFQGRSLDGGLSWSYGQPFEPVIPLGGTISQSIISFNFAYTKCGKLYSSARFQDMQVNPPNAIPVNGIIYNFSNDNGLTWSAPQIIYQNNFDLALLTPGVGFEGLALEIDPVNEDLIHVVFTDLVQPSTFYGNLFYFESRNGGISWTTPKQIYSMVNDPLWQKEHFDPAFTSDPNYFIYGGQTFNSHSIFLHVDENIILTPVIRAYPIKGSTTYTQNTAGVFDTIYDRAVIRSFDNGKTWSQIAGATEPYYFPFAHDPVTGVIPSIFIFGGSENEAIVYSPITGRLYMAYMAGNPSSSTDPLVILGNPYILLSASSDNGATWTKPIQINLTPKDIPIENQQAFQPNLILTQDGSLVVGYYDFRNYNGGSDPNASLNTDAWLAVYKETSEANGGSTGVGLDVVKEIRLTPQSYNARITLNSSLHSAASPIGFAVNQNNQLFVTFGMTNQNSPSNITTGYRGMTLDTNNRSNVFLQRYQFPKPSNE